MNNRKQQGNAICFAEVMKTFEGSGQSYNRNTTDSRIMTCWQGAKIYVPDNFQMESLLKLLRVMKYL